MVLVETMYLMLIASAAISGNQVEAGGQIAEKTNQAGLNPAYSSDDQVTPPVDPATSIPVVSGCVHDEQGRPAVGVLVARQWSFEQGDASPLGGVTTDGSGCFSLPLYPRESGPIGLMVLDTARGLGASVQVSPRAKDRRLSLELRPLVDVRASFVSGIYNGTNEIFWALYVEELGARIAWGQAEGGDVMLSLPRGRYMIAASAQKHQPAGQRFKVRKRPVHLGTIILESTRLAQLQGAKAPEIYTTGVRGVSAPVTLGSLRGQWILIDFWGFWCDPCVRGMPELIQFWNDHVDLHDRFEILAFHDPQVKTFEELDAALQPIVYQLWSGHTPPFPVLLDDTGSTVQRYGISGFPTYVLVDPEGNIVDSATGDSSQLLERLGRELKHQSADH